MENQPTNLIYYKEYVASVHYNAKDEMFYGKVEHASETITFKTDNAKQVKTEFEKAIEEYILYCNIHAIDPLKIFKGSFNVRIKPEVHKAVYFTAIKHGKSLNSFVREAIEIHLAKFNFK